MGTSQTDNDTLLADVASYYSAKIRAHGASPQGVDWNGKEGQDLRFEQLCKLIDRRGPFTITDLGCGYGALVDYLDARKFDFKYWGYDISEPMIEAARTRFAGNSRAMFKLGSMPEGNADYAVASGIFNVRLTHANNEWHGFLQDALDALDRASSLGFAFNCLTSYSDADKMRPDLFYANPREIFDICMHKYSRRVALLHDYELYEFTILVRK